jgi:transposase
VSWVDVSGDSRLANAQWLTLEALLPKGNGMGRRRGRDRLINGIRWRVRTGALWREVPDRNREMPVDSTLAWAHQHAAGARKGGPASTQPGGVGNESDRPARC